MVKLNRGPVALKYLYLSWLSENFQTVAQPSIEIYWSLLLGSKNSCWYTEIIILGSAAVKCSKNAKFCPCIWYRWIDWLMDLQNVLVWSWMDLQNVLVWSWMDLLNVLVWSWMDLQNVLVWSWMDLQNVLVWSWMDLQIVLDGSWVDLQIVSDGPTDHVKWSQMDLQIVSNDPRWTNRSCQMDPRWTYRLCQMDPRWT